MNPRQWDRFTDRFCESAGAKGSRATQAFFQKMKRANRLPRRRNAKENLGCSANAADQWVVIPSLGERPVGVRAVHFWHTRHYAI